MHLGRLSAVIKTIWLGSLIKKLNINYSVYLLPNQFILRFYCSNCISTLNCQFVQKTFSIHAPWQIVDGNHNRLAWFIYQKAEHFTTLLNDSQICVTGIYCLNFISTLNCQFIQKTFSIHAPLQIVVGYQNHLVWFIYQKN